MTDVTNRINVVNSWRYDAISRPTKYVDGLLNPTDIEYNNRGWISKIIYPDPDGPGGPLARAEDIRTYQPNGNLETRKDPRGNFEGTLSYRYDNDNRLTFSGDSLYGVLGEQYRYDNRGLLIGVERVRSNANPTAAQTTFTKIVDNQYDAFGRLVLRISYDFSLPDSNDQKTLFSERFIYNAAGELVERIDGTEVINESDPGNRYFNVYDQRGLLVQETQPDPDGAGPLFPLVIKYGYDNMGRPTQTDRGYGRVTRTEYNSRSWVKKLTEPDPDGPGQPKLSPVTIIDYDLRGDQLYVTDPLNRITSFTYDDEQRLHTTTEPDPDGSGTLLSSVTSFGYNANNWLTQITDPVGAVTDFTYDNLGRPKDTIEADPDGPTLPLTRPITTRAYAAKGLASIVDPMGRTISYMRDTRGRVELMSDTLGNTTSYTYDFYDNLRTRTEPDPDGTAGPATSPVWKWFYDPLNRVTSESDPDDKNLVYEYDSTSGKISKITDRVMNKTEFKYDNLNRLIEETNQNNDVRTYTYNVAGNLTRTVDRNRKVTQFSYDALDRAVSEQWLNYEVFPGIYSPAPATTVV